MLPVWIVYVLTVFSMFLPFFMALLRLKDLHSRLEYIDDFENPKIDLEQYITTPHVAGKFIIRDVKRASINRCLNLKAMIDFASR